MPKRKVTTRRGGHNTGFYPVRVLLKEEHMDIIQFHNSQGQDQDNDANNPHSASEREMGNFLKNAHPCLRGKGKRRTGWKGKSNHPLITLKLKTTTPRTVGNMGLLVFVDLNKT